MQAARVASPSPAVRSLSGRYDRQLTVSGFGPEVQGRLRNATALVAGVGGVGGTAALYLAAAGIGRLVLVHAGPLDLPDLNRQILMPDAGVGQERVHLARQNILRFNPEVEVVALAERITPALAPELLAGAGVALDCRHNFPERYALNEACVRLGVPMVEAAMYDMDAYITSLLPGHTPCLACLYPEAAPWDPLGFPVLGAVAGTLGCLAALEAIKLLTGWGRPLLGEILTMDLDALEFRRFRVRPRPNCPVCGGGASAVAGASSEG